MAAHLDDFERWGFDTRAWSGNTRGQYRRRIEAFERWLTGKQLRHASTQDAQRWLASLPVPGQALSANWMRERLREMAAEAGIEGRMHPHLLRATFATRLIELGVAVHDISDLMGHRDVSTLAHYVASRPERLAVAVEGLDLLDVA